MKVSILVPIYNVEQYIERCAISLFTQTYNNIEYVFVNDSSPDKSKELLLSIIPDDRKNSVIIIDHEHNRGLAAARLTALEYATGAYIMFVDSDDYLEPNAVERLMDKAKEGDFDIVTGGITHIFENRKIEELPPRNIDKHAYLRLLLESKVFHNNFPRVFKKSLFENNGDLFVEGINCGEDYLMITRVFYYADKISFVYQPLYNYIHVNPTSYTARFKRSNFDQLSRAEEIVRNFYVKNHDTEYLDSQIIGCLKAKAQNIILLLLNDYNISDYNDVVSRYADDEKLFLSKTPFQYRIILQMSNLLNHKTMAKIVRLGFKVKGFCKGIKS